MKVSHFLLASAILFSANKALAQRKETVKDVPIAVTIFDKGTLSFTNKMNLNYTNFSSRVNRDPKDFSFQADPSYFFIDGVAIGIDARTGSNSAKGVSPSSFSSWQTNLTATYGRNINDKLNAYIKLLAGPGGSHNEFTNGNNVQKLKATYFGIKGLVGLPIALESNSAAFFTPYFSYDSYKTNTSSSSDFKEKTIVIGFKLESYLGKAQMTKGRQQEDLFKGAYLQGSHFLEFTTTGSLSFNKRQQYQNGSSATFGKQKNNTTNLAFGYHYYFMDNLAAGLNFSVNSRKSGYIGAPSSPSDKTSTLMITPVITAQAPLEGAGRNLFLQASYGFGVYKAPKKNLTDLSVKAGYNLFLAKYLTLTPKIGYEHAKGTVPQGVSGISYVNSGLVVELGVRSWLNFWKWKK
ncbi:MAG: outer membrane beta-barrel protein [Chitinophagaceae bacterium]